MVDKIKYLENKYYPKYRVKVRTLGRKLIYVAQRRRLCYYTIWFPNSDNGRIAYSSDNVKDVIEFINNLDEKGVYNNDRKGNKF